MTDNPVRTWGQTTQRAEALDEIVELITGYLPPDSGISREALVSEIIGIIETKTGHRFIKATRYINEPAE